MPNFMSDEDLALESGDKRTCSHCHKTYWIDEYHSCPEMAESARKANDTFERNWKGSGKRRITTILITLETPDSDMAVDSALDMANLMGSEGKDDVLDLSWKIEKEVEVV